MRLSLRAAVLAACAVPLAWSPSIERAPEGRASYSYDYRCPTDYVLIGIGGRQGAWMDAAWGICGRIRSNGTLNSGDRRVTRRAGGSGGTTKGRVCPSGHVLVGWSGTARTYVHTIRTIRCSPWDTSNRIASGRQSYYYLFPEKGAGTFSNTLCQYGMIGVGISGQAGAYLDRFQVRCAYAPYANPPASIRPTSLRTYVWKVGRCIKDVYGNCI